MPWPNHPPHYYFFFRIYFFNFFNFIIIFLGHVRCFNFMVFNHKLGTINLHQSNVSVGLALPSTPLLAEVGRAQVSIRGRAAGSGLSFGWDLNNMIFQNRNYGSAFSHDNILLFLLMGFGFNLKTQRKNMDPSGGT